MRVKELNESHKYAYKLKRKKTNTTSFTEIEKRLHLLAFDDYKILLTVISELYLDFDEGVKTHTSLFNFDYVAFF